MEEHAKKSIHETTESFIKLPDDLLHRILCLLPLKTTIQTSVLSKEWENQWKELWKYATKLEFGRQFASTLSREAYADFLGKILQVHKGQKIEKFQLFFFPGNEYRVAAREWVELVLTKGARELDLNFRGSQRRDIQNEVIRESSNYQYLPDCFYISSSITSLRLTCCSFVPPANFNGFSFLKSIILRGVNISGESIGAMVCSSPLLEDLVVKGCCPLAARKINSLRVKHLTIDCCWHANETENFAPNLENLYFVSRLSETPVLRDVSSLSDATIHVIDEFGLLYGMFWLRFLTCLSHVGKLSLILKPYPRHAHNVPSVTFHNLRELELHCFLTHDDSHDICMFFPFCSFPRMEKLTMSLPSGNLIWLRDHWRIHDPQSPIRCEFRQLKEIRIINFVGREYEMKLVELLLEKTPVLQMLVLRFPLRSECGEYVEAPSKAHCNQLSRIPKVSVEARIIISGYN